MNDNQTICIYGIRNSINGRMYVGQTVNLKKRQDSHMCSLRYNKHQNKELQADFNKCGLFAFTFVILESHNSYLGLDIKEQRWIDFYNQIGKPAIYNEVLKVA